MIGIANEPKCQLTVHTSPPLTHKPGSYKTDNVLEKLSEVYRNAINQCYDSRELLAMPLYVMAEFDQYYEEL